MDLFVGYYGALHRRPFFIILLLFPVLFICPSLIAAQSLSEGLINRVLSTHVWSASLRKELAHRVYSQRCPFHRPKALLGSVQNTADLYQTYSVLLFRIKGLATIDHPEVRGEAGIEEEVSDYKKECDSLVESARLRLDSSHTKTGFPTDPGGSGKPGKSGRNSPSSVANVFAFHCYYQAYCEITNNRLREAYQNPVLKTRSRRAFIPLIGTSKVFQIPNYPITPNTPIAPDAPIIPNPRGTPPTTPPEAPPRTPEITPITHNHPITQ